MRSLTSSLHRDARVPDPQPATARMWIQSTMGGLIVLAVWLAAESSDQVLAAEPDSTPPADVGEPAAAPDFGRQVRPILSDHCFACHGPDENDRQADLRLDTADGLAYVIDPDDVDASELLDRIDQDDPDLLMPPPGFHKPLSDGQKQTLRRWVASGGQFEMHWAFQPPAAAAASADDPEGQEGRGELRDVVDSLIEQRIDQVGLKVNGRADDRTLLRRVCLDLTGLPPSREQIEAFDADASPDRYERLVDRLLASSDFGRHVGRHWLDLVRYADTHGLHLDNYREMWPYRDWVIDAINQNMPFDQFITKQLAGDLVENATIGDRIASGFNRLNVTTNEGGSIYDEVFARNCIDRTDAFGTVFLGLTTQCAVCHDHKFDPISQKDYYSLLAFFNSIDGRAMDGNSKTHPPSIKVPSEEQKAEEVELNQSLAQLDREMKTELPAVDRAQRQWEQTIGDQASVVLKPLVPANVTSRENATFQTDDDAVVRLIEGEADRDQVTLIAPLPPGQVWQTLRLDSEPDPASNRVGLTPAGNVVLSEIKVSVRTADADWRSIPVEAAFASLEQDDQGYAVDKAIDGVINDATGWAVAGHKTTGPRTAWFYTPGLIADDNQTQVRIEMFFESKYAKHQFRNVRFSIGDGPPSIPEDQKITLSPVHVMGPFEVENPNAGGYRNAVSVTSSPQWDQVTHYGGKDFRWRESETLPQVEIGKLDRLEDRSSFFVAHRSIESPRKQTIKLLYDADDGLILFLNGKEIRRHMGTHAIDPLTKQVDLPLKKGVNDLFFKAIDFGGQGRLSYAFRSLAIDTPASVKLIAETPPKERSEPTIRSIRKYFRAVACVHPDWIALRSQRQAVANQLQTLRGAMPNTLVWKELAKPRVAHILNRGQYDDPGEVVQRGVPSFLPPMPEDAPLDRMGLARWLTDPRHPLTARVAVNRYWQMIFGTGIVKTSEDFGSQGEVPSHRELLDQLATDFVTHGWDVKRLVRQLVLTDAYTRDAHVEPDMIRIDPDNRFYARGPRHRLDAEVLRDQSLALSGLLVPSDGGPSVKPPQPDGLWKAVAYTDSDTAKFVADQGDKTLRRSVYIFWKRTSAPPQMSTFDAPSRESCTARRERTNTPLQALLLMNETQYLQASQALADRALAEPGINDDAERAAWLFETVTAREPLPSEKDEIMGLLADTAAYYESRPDLAGQLMGGLDPRQAAWTVLSSTLLNLDEVVSK